MTQYDAIVIGAGIAGLGVAGILQSKGIKTLILEKSKMPGGRAKTREIPGGWKVDSGTHCVNLGDRSPCASLLKRVGKEIKWTRPIEGFMVYSAGRWLPVNEYLEISDEEIGQLSSLEERFKNITDDEIDELDNVSLADFIKENVESPKVAEYISLIGMVQTTLTESEIISMGEFAYIYREGMKYSRNEGILNTVRMPLGGISEMIKAQAEAVTSMGGVIEYATPVKRVEVDHAGPGAIITENESYSAPVVIMAMPIWKMVKVIPIEDENSPLPRAWRERMKSLVDETSASMGYTIGTNAPLFTEPVYLSNWRIPDVGLPLQVLGHTNFDDTIAPEGHMIAFIGAPCKPQQARDEAFRRETLTKFWEVIKEMFPGIEDKLVWKADGFYVGIDGLSRSPGLTGKYRPEVFLPEVPGLYFAGDCYTGRGIGMNAAANSAMICADRILEDMGKG